MQVVTKSCSTKALLVLLLISFVFNIFFIYRIFNTALSLDYSRAEQTIQQERAKRALSIIRYMVIGSSNDLLKKIAENLSKEGFIVKSTHFETQIGDVVFTVSENKVVSVKYIK